MAWRPKGKVFGKYLLLTNILTGTFLDGLADYTEQKLEGAQPHDWGRTTRMASMGFVLAPTDHYWYRFLDRRLPKRDVKTVAKKVLLEMTIVGPLEIVIFYLGKRNRKRETGF